MVIIKPRGKCQFEGCDAKATTIAAMNKRSQGITVDCYCASHAVTITDHNNPEYKVDCPNCGCEFGVN